MLKHRGGHPWSGSNEKVGCKVCWPAAMRAYNISNISVTPWQRKVSSLVFSSNAPALANTQASASKQAAQLSPRACSACWVPWPQNQVTWTFGVINFSKKVPCGHFGWPRNPLIDCPQKSPIDRPQKPPQTKYEGIWRGRSPMTFWDRPRQTCTHAILSTYAWKVSCDR